MPIIDNRGVGLIKIQVTGLEHPLPGRDDNGVELSAVGFVAAPPDSRVQVFGQTYLTQIRPLKDIRVLMHFADSMLAFVFLVYPYFQFNHRVNGHIRDNVTGISQQPGKCFLPRWAVKVSDLVNSRLDHVTGTFVMHPIRPGRSIVATDIQVRIIRTDRAEFAKADNPVWEQLLLA